MRAATTVRAAAGAPSRRRLRCPRRRGGQRKRRRRRPGCARPAAEEATRLSPYRTSCPRPRTSMPSRSPEGAEHVPDRPAFGDGRHHRRSELCRDRKLIAVEQQREIGPLERADRRQEVRRQRGRFGREARRRRRASRARPGLHGFGPRRESRRRIAADDEEGPYVSGLDLADAARRTATRRTGAAARVGSAVRHPASRPTPEGCGCRAAADSRG